MASIRSKMATGVWSVLFWAIGGIVFWMAFLVLSKATFGWKPEPTTVATAAVVVMGLVILFTSHSSGFVIGFTIVGIVSWLVSLLAFHLLPDLVGAFFRYTLWEPFVFLIGYSGITPEVIGAVGLGLVGVVGAVILYTILRTDPAVDWSLTLKMVVCPLVLAVLLVGFFTMVWRVVEITVEVGLFFLGIEFDTRVAIARVVTFGVFAAFVALELSGAGTIERQENSIAVSSENFPTLYSTTTRVASQLDIPMPTITVSQRTEPEAITRGYRPGNIHLILSQGTLNALTDEELEAVIAHELAHVANMDAVVMTVVSLPVLLSDGLQSRMTTLIEGDFGEENDSSEDDESDTDRNTADDADRGFLGGVFRTVSGPFVRLGRRLFGGVRRVVSAVPEAVKKVVVPLVLLLGLLIMFILAPIGIVLYSSLGIIVMTVLLIATFTEYLSRPTVAVLSRARESAADRTAATVTGSPTALASALRTLDERIAETPSEDLRKSSGLSSLSIVPLKPVGTNIFTSEADGITKSVDEVLMHIVRTLFATHPPTERRIDTLTSLSEEHDTEP